MGYETPYASTIGGVSAHDSPAPLCRQFSQSPACNVSCAGVFPGQSRPIPENHTGPGAQTSRNANQQSPQPQRGARKRIQAPGKLADPASARNVIRLLHDATTFSPMFNPARHLELTATLDSHV